MLGFVAVAVVAALGFATINFYAVRRLDTGTELMVELAGAIQEGADAFIRHEYRIIFTIAVFIMAALMVIVSWYAGVAFILGALMSASAGWIGMKIATIANVRVSNRARRRLTSARR
jgi:K(+)-stimulated pyrophosphate-energized sodium pump